jgi:protein subunit release factor A
MRSNLNILKIFLQFNQIHAKRYMLTTTQIKILNSYDIISSYIEKRLHNEQKLNAAGTLQFNTNDYRNLKKFQELFDIVKRIRLFENEIADLTNLINTTADDDEIKKLGISDLENADNEMRSLKFKLVENLNEDENEDKENAILEVSPGVGGQGVYAAVYLVFSQTC